VRERERGRGREKEREREKESNCYGAYPESDMRGQQKERALFLSFSLCYGIGYAQAADFAKAAGPLSHTHSHSHTLTLLVLSFALFSSVIL